MSINASIRSWFGSGILDVDPIAWTLAAAMILFFAGAHRLVFGTRGQQEEHTHERPSNKTWLNIAAATLPGLIWGGTVFAVWWRRNDLSIIWAVLVASTLYACLAVFAFRILKRKIVDQRQSIPDQRISD